MFDPVTARLLQTAPPLEDLDPNDLPAILTQQYAELVARRLRGSEVGDLALPATPSGKIRNANVAASAMAIGFLQPIAHRAAACKQRVVGRDVQKKIRSRIRATSSFLHRGADARFAVDSLLEEAGFELSVPPETR